MIWSWFKRRRRHKLTSQPFPEDWRSHIDRNVEHWSALTEGERRQLEGIVQVLVAEKNWEGCGGLSLDDEIRTTIAAQAGLLLLGIDHDYYRNVLSILVYPAGYVLPREREVPGGAVLTDERVPVLGQAQLRGPVVLSWRSARHGGQDGRDGKNLVFHEFAHKLDMLDGWIDGMPPLDGDEKNARWIRVMTAAYERLQQRAEHGRPTLLDPYGATDVGEFFAVATEIFFEKPLQLKDDQPEAYAVLQDFFGQDPATRWGTRRVGRS